MPKAGRRLRRGAILSSHGRVRSYPLTLIALAVCSRLHAQLPSDSAARPAQAVYSIGQPPRWQPYVGAYGLWTSGSPGSGGGGGLAGIYRPILNPITGLLGAAAEATVQARSDGALGGARAMARAPAFGIGVGIDWQYEHGLAPILSFETAIRRGGLLGHGTMLRLDWLPGSRHTVTAGVRVPLLQPLAGRTRPTRTSARLPDAPPNGTPDEARFAFADSTRRLLGAIAADAAVIRAYTSLYMDDDARTLMAVVPRAGNTFESVAHRYDESLVRAFSSVMGEGTAVSARVATRARESAVTRVILPYNALFGQVKDGCALGGLVAEARADFARWLRDSIVLSDDARRGVLAVHGRWLEILRDQCTQLLREWKDSRLLWLPLQLALAPDEYDSQESVDTLIAHAVGHAFTDRNALRYLRTADLPLEIARSILGARKYHVLWTHDFTGRRDTGSLDDIAYTMVADAYLPALTAAAARYDSVGTFPQYVILLDAFYYHARAGTLLMSILENPLEATVRFGRGEEAQAAHLRQRLSELRTAVARSTRLRREAAAHGSDWLRRVVKVHVNVTQPSDFSFRSAHIIPPIPFTPDNVMRDHRKLALYDFTEAAPYDGALLVTGIGIGEHYSSSTWEDRGYEIRGPAALEARASARRTLVANGISEDRLPSMLLETRMPAAADGALLEPGAARAYIGHALQVHNEIGFGPKRSSVARAILYTLAAPGTVIVVPDPLWMSESWAAMLAAAAARGCHVMIIAPALANAPSPEPPLITLENAMLQHLLAIRSQLADQIAASGGSLRIGIYASRAPASDIAGRYSEIRAGLTRAPWIRDLIPFDAQTLDQLNQVLAQTERAEREATTIARDEKPRVPQLHQKTVLIARRSAIASLVRQPGWADLLARAMRGQATRSVRLADALGGPPAAGDTTLGQSLDTLFRRYEQSLTPAERKRVSFYFSVGSQNHDPRGIMLDGEASVIVAGVQGSAGLVDLFYLMARTTWVDSPSEVDRLVPRPRGLLARIARLIRFTM